MTDFHSDLSICLTSALRTPHLAKATYAQMACTRLRKDVSNNNKYHFIDSVYMVFI